MTSENTESEVVNVTIFSAIISIFSPPVGARIADVGSKNIWELSGL